jgi:hypothetical protein
MNTKRQRVMKNRFLTISKVFCAVGIVSLIGISSCNKDNNKNGGGSSTTVTEADAVELTTDAVSPSTGGFDAQIQASVTIYTTVYIHMSCGDKRDTTLSYSTPTNFIPNYSYNLSWNYQLNCTNNIPSTFAFGFSGSTTYNGVLMQSSDQSTGSLNVTGLSDPSNFTYNSSYERSGKQTSKVGFQKSFSSDLKITSSGILVSKATHEIVSGTATVSITGQSSNGNSFSFSGTLTFLGNKKATLVMASGASYNISWS